MGYATNQLDIVVSQNGAIMIIPFSDRPILIQRESIEYWISIGPVDMFPIYWHVRMK